MTSLYLQTITWEWGDPPGDRGLLWARRPWGWREWRWVREGDVHDPPQTPKTIPEEWGWEFVEDHAHQCRGYPEWGVGPLWIGTRRDEFRYGPSRRPRQSCYDMGAICALEFPLHPIEEGDDDDDDDDEDGDCEALGALELIRADSFASLPC